MNVWQNKRLQWAAIPFFLVLTISALLLSLSTALNLAVYALDCTVGSGKTFSTIQAAIDDSSCDTIIIDAGDYSENLSIGRSVRLQSADSSKPVIDGNDNGRVITIDGGGDDTVTVYLTNLRLTNGDATSDSTSARNGGGVLVTGSAVLHADNLQLDNNIASTAAQTGFGGGVAINAGAAYITDTLVTDNYANRRTDTFTGGGQGGGLYVNGSTYLSLYSSEITNNVAAYRAGSSSPSYFAAGGGLFQNGDSTVELSQNVWDGNVARDVNSLGCDDCTLTVGSGDGGAVAVQVINSVAQLYVDGDHFTNNVANASDADYGSNEKAGGGAISLMATNTDGEITGTIRSAYFSGNVAKAGSGATSGNADGRGGAIHARLATVIVYASTILDNQAAVSGTGSGGGIYIREPESGNYLEVINTILAGNTASALGEGAQIYANYSNDSSASALIAHSTLADDTLNSHEALFYFGPTAGDELYVLNSIIANHDVGIQNVNATGWARARYLLFYNNNDNHPSPGTTAFPGDDETTWISGDPNPLFVDPANGNYHILPGSPAIDAGGDPQTEISRVIDSDVDGEMRPNALGPGYDIGADELDLLHLYLPMVVRE